MRAFFIFEFVFGVLLLNLATQTDSATEYNRYLAHIFQKYGSGDTLTFEGLEHLMYNLGLGGIEFEPQHTIDEHRPQGFKGMQNQRPNFKTPENEEKVQKYFEDDMKELVGRENGGNMDEPMQVAHGFIQKSAPHQKLPWDLDDSPDILMKDRNLAKKSIILEFREMHDPRHRHPREKTYNFDGPTPLLSENVCLSPQDVLRLVVNHDDLHKRKLYKTVTAASETIGTTGTTVDKDTKNNNNNDVRNSGTEHNTEAEYIDFINSVHLTPLAFMKLCPALLAQIDQHVCVRPAPLQHADDPKQELWNAWLYASASIFILSACGLLGIALVPLMETIAYQEILKFLVAVAVGTLSGDALMHLLPHALVQEHKESAPAGEASASAGHGHSHDNTAVWICACAFGTAVFMYTLEHLLPLLRGESGHMHGHTHNHHKPDSNNDARNEKPTAIPIEAADVNAAMQANQGEVKDIKELNVMLNETKLDLKGPKSGRLTPVAFMVIIGDGLHNLTDGLAIGAAFATDPVTGFATAFAVLCHELPHELGDFALLLQTGVPIRRAVILNIVSSVLSFVGMAIGLLIAGLQSNMSQWIYGGTAGSFLYIAFADLMPAMNEGNGQRDMKSVLIQIAGIVVGGLIMILIAVNEEHLEELFK